MGADTMFVLRLRVCVCVLCVRVRVRIGIQSVYTSLYATL